MSQRKKTKRQRSKPRQRQLKPSSPNFILDQFQIGNMRAERKFQKDLEDLHLQHFQELLEHRKAVWEDLQAALLKSCVPLTLDNGWQRIVRYQYSDRPLSAAGSLKDEGGRFNVGNIHPLFPSFSALYIANSRETAAKEYYGKSTGEKYSVEDNMLADTKSVSWVSIKGQINMVFDLTITKNLNEFAKINREFSFSDRFLAKARKLNITLSIINTAKQIQESFLDPNWRFWPMQMEMPANSQIFGHIAYTAGIEAIAFPSKYLSGTNLAIFPRNFEDSDSIVEIADAAPERVVTKLSKDTWKELTGQ